MSANADQRGLPAPVKKVLLGVTKGLLNYLTALILMTLQFKQAWTLASVLAQSGSLTGFRDAIEKQPDLINKPIDDVTGETLLHDVCQNGVVECARILLDAGADPLAKSSFRHETCLHRAARCNAVGVVELLLDRGVDINVLGGGPEPNQPAIVVTPFMSPLDGAAMAGSEEVVELLLKRDAKLLVNSPSSHTSALHRAVEGWYVVTGFGGKGWQENPPRYPAAGNRKVIELLLRYGANLNDVDFAGNKPFHIAIKYNATDVLDLLLTDYREQIDINERGEHGFPPLQLALQLLGSSKLRQDNGSAVIQLLLKHGADKSLKGGPETNQLTAFEAAMKEQVKLRKPQEILDLLDPSKP
jgi:ankyrin repeat protein